MYSYVLDWLKIFSQCASMIISLSRQVEVGLVKLRILDNRWFSGAILCSMCILTFASENSKIITRGR